MSELACGQLSSYVQIIYIVLLMAIATTLIVEWGVDLLWQHTLVLTTLKGHNPLPGMVYSTYANGGSRGGGPRAKRARKILGRSPKSAGHTPL